METHHLLFKIILQAFSHFSYVTAHSPTLLSLLLHHMIFTHVTWRAAQEIDRSNAVEPVHNHCQHNVAIDLWLCVTRSVKFEKLLASLQLSSFKCGNLVA